MGPDVFFRCVIPGRPRILKNGKVIKKSQLTGRRFIGSSDRYSRWADFAKIWIYKARGPVRPVDHPVNLTVRIYLKNHQHECDLSNAYQGIEDLLQKCGIISNDRLIYSHDGSRKIFAPEERERVEIEIRPVT